MHPDPQDTIVALSSPAGPGDRAVVRLSGPAAFATAGRFFSPSPPHPIARRRLFAGQLSLPEVPATLAADLYLWPAPGTYTGQDLAELHLISSPPLVDLLVASLLTAGARAAQPGEFTLRAFLAGKLDLTRAEAVRGVIEATSRDELRDALAQLAGGVTRPLEGLREDLLDLLAEVEAALDFAEEDIQFVGREDLLHRLAKGLAQVTLVQKQLVRRGVADRPFRVVLAGAPNAGKSSLFNALTGAAALVSRQPGTTRDYLVAPLQVNGLTIELVDTAGWQEAASDIERQAQRLAREQAERADLVVWCVEAGPQAGADPARPTYLAHLPDRAVLAVATKCDLAGPPAGRLPTSAVTGAGLDELKLALVERARAHVQPALAPSLGRCRHHVQRCLEHLRAAHAAVLHEEPAELLALELRGALDQLGEMVGAVYSDDLLDRIFSRFCIGK
jgi:tRNA modification GTPase